VLIKKQSELRASTSGSNWTPRDLAICERFAVHSNSDIVDRHVAAELLNVSIRQLQRWHHRGFGPPRKRWKSCREFRYSRAEIEQWLSEHLEYRKA
jgi:hypothetical protein